MSNTQYLTSESLDPLGFYDLIINLNSLYSISSGNISSDYGINIEKSEKGKEIYEDYKNKHSSIIGMLGYSNVGKSFLLSLLTNKKIPDGYAVQTKGISIKYPESETTNFIILDSEGSEMPITETAYLKKSEEEIKDAKKYYETLKLAVLDKKATEIFIQKFLLEYCNILIVVVGAMALRDQKYLNILKKERGIETIFVCHNLKDCIKKEQVLQYIEETFKKDIFLNCEERIITNLDEKNDNHYIHYYYETINHPDYQTTQIIHVFLANNNESVENTAKSYFNENAIKFLRAQLKSFTQTRNFDAIKLFKKFLIRQSNEFFEHDVSKPCIEENDLKYIDKIEHEKNPKHEVSKIYVEKKLKLKECNFDEFGKSNFFSMNIIPDYSYYIGTYKKEKKKKKNETNDTNENNDAQEYECLIIEIELPGKIENPEFNLFYDYDNYKQKFTFKAKKVVPEEEDIEIYNDDIRKGMVELTIFIDMDECKLDRDNKDKPIKCKHTNGILIVYIPTINEKDNNKNVIIEVETKKKKKNKSE